MIVIIMWSQINEPPGPMKDHRVLTGSFVLLCLNDLQQCESNVI